MMTNDVYQQDAWKLYCLKMFGDCDTRPHHLIPFLRKPILPETYLTAVHDLTKPLDKEQRKAVNRDRTSVIHSDWEIFEREAKNAGKAIDGAREQSEILNAEFYLGMEGTNVVSGLEIIPGKEWILEMCAWGPQDAIKGRVCDEWGNKGFKHYDLCGLRGDGVRDRFKLKWAEKMEVRLR